MLFFCVSLLTRKKVQKTAFVPQCWGLTQSTHSSVLRDVWSRVTTGENKFQWLYCISTFPQCNANFSNSALAFLLCLMGEMDIFISLARFLLPAIRPEVITQLRSKATSLTVYSGFSLCMSAAMKSFWKWFCRAQAARDLCRERVPALPAETHPSSPPVPKEPSSKILRRVCLFVQKYFVWGKSRCNQTHVS